jgi:hypothetical protein
MRDDRFEVSVTFDERRGYVASAPELRQPVTALSLGALRRRIEALLLRPRRLMQQRARQEDRSASGVTSGRNR